MRLILSLCVPPLLFLLWWGWRHVRKAPLKRNTVNVVSALLLLAYFVGTAGLGVFWVARQELPVFDWHYAFGYVTVLLVAGHVAYNTRAIKAWFVGVSKGTPLGGAALDERERDLRPVLRLAGALGLGAGLIGLGVWQGYQAGSETVRLELVVPEGAASGGASAEDRAEYRVEVLGDDARPIALHFHRETSFGRYRPFDGSTGFEWDSAPKTVYKPYPSAPQTELARAWRTGLPELGAALARRQAPVPDLSVSDRFTLEELAHLLFHTNGLTSPEQEKRAAPSAGALYPTVLYVVVNRVEGLAPGLYHYAVDTHRLQRVREGEVSAELAACVERSRLVERAALSVVLSAIFHRSGWKYGSRAYRYCLLDTGFVAGNLGLVAASLGRSTVPLARFDDARVSTVLGVDGHEEAPLLVVPIGRRLERDPGATREPRFRTFRIQQENLATRLIPLVQRATSFERVGFQLGSGVAPLGSGARSGGAGAEGAKSGGAGPGAKREGAQGGREGEGERIDLPEGSAAPGALAAAIRTRRTRRSFLPAPLPLADFAGVLRDVGQGPVIAETDALELYVIVNRVEGVPPGSYRYDPQRHALFARERRAMAKATGEAALDQDMGSEGHVNLVLVANAERMVVPDGQRGYRHVSLHAGLVGQTLYLSGEARGHSVSAMGSFYEDEVGKLLGVDPKRHLVLLMQAFGPDPERWKK